VTQALAVQVTAHRLPSGFSVLMTQGLGLGLLWEVGGQVGCDGEAEPSSTVVGHSVPPWATVCVLPREGQACAGSGGLYLCFPAKSYLGSCQDRF
jgi:hypothetical protein